MAKHVYIICPVRLADATTLSEIRSYADDLRACGVVVHFPPDDAPQEDPTGSEICRAHRTAMLQADEVHVFWDVESKGSHFDLGMAYALNKHIVGVWCRPPDTEGKSYWKAVIDSRWGLA